MRGILVSCCIFFLGGANAQQAVSVSTADITHFWEAYDSLALSKDSVKTLQRLYINRATPGFREFIKLRNFTAKEYVTLIKKYPKFWISIRPNTERIASRRHEIEEVFDKFRTIYPQFNPPDVCFAIGGLRTGGTTTSNLILIGSEIASSDSSTNKSEFTGWLTYIIGNTGDIVSMVAHEAVHTQQRTSVAFSGYMRHRLLTQSMREGAADFIGKMVIGSIINKTQHTYGLAHEYELWKEFEAEMLQNNISNWLYNGNTSHERPADLGYFIGARICERYYQQAENKSKAIQDIIRMKDAKKFLKESGYAGSVD